MPSTPLNLALGPLMVDVVGQALDKDDIDLLCHPAVGSVILFKRNYQSRQQISELTKHIKSLRTPELVVAVDQEGGRVQRFQDEFFRLPPAHQFASVYDQKPEQGRQLAQSAGLVMATEIIETGVDFSFAPVLDSADLNSEVIGDRAFHDSPRAIVDLAEAFIKGMNAAGMAATGKHFPGHGGVIEDSHFECPVDHRKLNELESCDLVPYRQLAHQLGGVMTAHVAFPNINGSLPTYSEFWLKQVLREDIGFKGVIFSDDLTMKGALGAGSISERCDLALQAGCDCALICNDPEAARTAAEQLKTPLTKNNHIEFMRRQESAGTQPTAKSVDKAKQELSSLLS